MTGLEDTIRHAKHSVDASLVLPDLGVRINDVIYRLDLRFIWQDDGKLLVVSHDIAARHDLMQSLNQTRREQRIAEERIEAQQRQLAAQAQALSAANTDLRRFSLAMSHDLQAPVRQIKRFAELIGEDGHGLDARRLDFLNEISLGATRMQAMIGTLLRYMRIAQQEPSFAEIELDDAVELAKANLRSDIMAAGAQILLTPLPTVLGEEGLLALVFQNLIQNSLKYRAQEPPHIVIAANVQDKFAHISVTDNGRGIDPVKAPKAFMLFQRINADQAISGIGAGLPVCQRIVEMHGGTIWIDTDWQPGLRVIFTIPIVR
jgi:light-regulated signal transduction histidine kinase (bacteriophytochrome)